jgi:hypothetical protein
MLIVYKQIIYSAFIPQKACVERIWANVILTAFVASKIVILPKNNKATER